MENITVATLSDSPGQILPVNVLCYLPQGGEKQLPYITDSSRGQRVIIWGDVGVTVDTPDGSELTGLTIPSGRVRLDKHSLFTFIHLMDNKWIMRAETGTFSADEPLFADYYWNPQENPDRVWDNAKIWWCPLMFEGGLWDDTEVWDDNKFLGTTTPT